MRENVKKPTNDTGRGGNTGGQVSRPEETDRFVTILSFILENKFHRVREVDKKELKKLLLLLLLLKLRVWSKTMCRGQNEVMER